MIIIQTPTANTGWQYPEPAIIKTDITEYSPHHINTFPVKAITLLGASVFLNHCFNGRSSLASFWAPFQYTYQGFTVRRSCHYHRYVCVFSTSVRAPDWILYDVQGLVRYVCLISSYSTRKEYQNTNQNNRVLAEALPFCSPRKVPKSLSASKSLYFISDFLISALWQMLTLFLNSVLTRSD